MNTKQMLEDFWKDVIEVRPSDIHSETICIVTDDDMQKYTRKLIEALAEELIGEEPIVTAPFHNEILNEVFYAKAQWRAEQRLKVKEILSNLK